MNILHAKWTPAEGYKILHGDRAYPGSLDIFVDAIPKVQFRWIGKYLYGEADGYCEIYEHRPGTTRAFGGRTITIHFEDGTTRDFIGSLWDPFSIPDTIPPIRHVGITDERNTWEGNGMWYSGKITLSLYQEILAMLETHGKKTEYITVNIEAIKRIQAEQTYDTDTEDLPVCPECGTMNKEL